MTNNQYITMLIDRSGSMRGKELDTIGGINTMLTQLKNNKNINENIFITIKLFDHEINNFINDIEIDYVELLKSNDFIPRGPTALLDTLGLTLDEILKKKKNNILFYDSYLIYVCTDGLENASNLYKKNDIKKLIEDCKKENINVLYIGANQDSFLEAETIGINSDSVMNYHESSDTIKSAYNSLAQVATRIRSLGAQPSFTQAERQASVSTNESAHILPPNLKRERYISYSENDIN